MDLLNHVVPYLGSLGVFTHWLAFIASLVESLAFVGILIPGTALVVLAGFSAAQGIVNPYYLVLFVALGAIIGDTFSYYLGTKGAYLFKENSRVFKISHLEKSKIFFQRHGNKSVFLARFISPLRPFVPFFAGMSHMNLAVFIFWNVFSAVLWSISFVCIGYFFGQAFQTIELWVTRGGVGVVFFGLICFGSWFVIKNRKSLFAFLNKWL